MLNPIPREVHVKHYLLRWILIVSIPTRSTSLWSPFYRCFKAVRENNIKLLFLTSQWMDLFRFALACRWDSHVWWSPTNLPRLASTKNCCAHRGWGPGKLEAIRTIGEFSLENSETQPLATGKRGFLRVFFGGASFRDGSHPLGAIGGCLNSLGESYSKIMAVNLF